MNSAKKKRLESAGWKVGSTKDFLGLTREEAELVDMKLALGQVLKRYRTRRRHTGGSGKKARFQPVESGEAGIWVPGGHA